ncbi:dimethylaniline monooxygenase [N-oxide-forming] 4 [Aspergillus udagawae]|nr:dimethylaniline monooxygenase [N-oxide-forming] 4 [Aspergillus udagawae]GFG27499.1 dimethylaniline monooxygenase [N-oxide-forming] 4 [Aspergillus udagawae]
MGSSMNAERVEVVVVGAGWNGLISAKTYLDFRPSADLVILDEQASIGGVWSADKIYPSLYAQIKYGLFEYSFYPMRNEGITEDGYISGDTIHTYLNDFAWDFDLVRRTRLRTAVTNVFQLPSGNWRLEIAGKPDIECEKLIYASGATSHPVIPVWPKAASFSAPIIHSCETGTHLDALRQIQSATVVGGAKSSYDTVFLLLKAGKKVNWIIREDGCGPLAIMPPKLLGMVNTMDVVTTRAMMLMGLSIMSTDGPVHQFFQRTIVGRFILWLFWLVVNWLAERHAGYSKSENAKKLRPMPHGNGIFWANAGLGAASAPLFWKTFHAGECTVHRTEIDSFGEDNTVRLKDGTSFQTDYVILSTGFDKSFHVFSKELQHKYGLMPHADRSSAEERKWARLEAEADQAVDELLPALQNAPRGIGEGFIREKTTGGHHILHGPSRHYRRLVVPSLVGAGDRSIYFPGFIHSIYTPTVSEVQALWGVAFLLGLHDPPSLREMEQEVAEWNVWTRKRYVGQGRKHAYAIFDFLPYIDVLLKDLGVNPRRKKSLFAHLFMPSYPRDYKGIIDEFRQTLAATQASKSKHTVSFALPSPSAAKYDGMQPGAQGHGRTSASTNGYSTGLSLNGNKPSRPLAFAN